MLTLTRLPPDIYTEYCIILAELSDICGFMDSRSAAARVLLDSPTGWPQARLCPQFHRLNINKIFCYS